MNDYDFEFLFNFIYTNNLHEDKSFKDDFIEYLAEKYENYIYDYIGSSWIDDVDMYQYFYEDKDEESGWLIDEDNLYSDLERDLGSKFCGVYEKEVLLKTDFSLQSIINNYDFESIYSDIIDELNMDKMDIDRSDEREGYISDNIDNLFENFGK